MKRSNEWGTCQKSAIIEKDRKKKGKKATRAYVREDTDNYKKTNRDQENRVYDIIENTDKYRKSGIKVIKSIKLDL